MFKKISLILILLSTALLVYVCYGRKDLILSKKEVKERYRTPVSKFINWNGNEIHYTDDGAGIPVLMIHGFGGSTGDFYTLDSLIRDKYRVIRVDVPGFGLSDFPAAEEKNADYSKFYNEFFTFFLDTLHLDSLYVMGNSLGGYMSWKLCVQHPDKIKKLVLFNSAGYDMENVLKSANVLIFRHMWVKALLHEGLPEYMTRRATKKIFYDNSFLAERDVKRMNDLWNRKGNLDHIIAMVNSDKYMDTTLIRKVACPTLIIWGKYDQVVPVNHAARFHRDIPNSRVIIYDSCGHVPMMERPNDVKRDVLKFFSE